MFEIGGLVVRVDLVNHEELGRGGGDRNNLRKVVG